MSKRKFSAEDEIANADDDKVFIQPLGAGQEVGRSCIYLKFKGKKILLDCGIHPGMSGQDSLPYFDLIQNELEDIDLLLISHFHLDHVGALPWLLKKTPFKGRCFMTHATKATYKWLLLDYLRVSTGSPDKKLYSESDVEESMELIETMNFHQEREVNGIRFWCYNAGHVLGAAMFMVEIAGVKTLYTGDFSRQEDRHLMSAELPKVRPDVLIVESTYGTHVHESREEREERFTRIVRDTITRGGRCLIPAFALGRAQELLLLLDEYWSVHPELQRVPVYYASTLAKKCMSVYQTYVHSMNEKIQNQVVVSNPFKFKHISYLRSADHFEDVGPSVVLASPGMMQSGLSRQLFESWCSDPKNGLIVAGYCVEGTLAKHVLTMPEEIVTTAGQRLPLKCSVDYISFSAHTDCQQTSDFVGSLKPKHIVLVHGEKNEMSRLKAALSAEYAIDIHNPRNGQSVEIPFETKGTVKIVGGLAAKKAKHGDVVSGVLVEQNSTRRIVAPSELPSQANLQHGLIKPKVVVPFNGSYNQLFRHLLHVCQEVEPAPPAMKVCKAVTVSVAPGSATMEWTYNRFANMVAETIGVAIMTMPENLPDTPLEEPDCGPESRFYEELMMILEDMFGSECIDPTSRMGMVHLAVDGCHVTVDTEHRSLTCDDPILHKSLSSVIRVLNERDPTRRY